MTVTEGAALFWIRVASCIVIQMASKLPKLRLEIIMISESVVGMVVLDVVLGVEDVKVHEDVRSMLDGAADVPDEVVLCNVVTETVWFTVLVELKMDVAKFTLCFGEIVEGLTKALCTVDTVNIATAVDCFVNKRNQAPP